MDSHDEVSNEAADEPVDPEDLAPEDAALLADIRVAYEQHDPVPPGLAKRTTPPGQVAGWESESEK